VLNGVNVPGDSPDMLAPLIPSSRILLVARQAEDEGLQHYITPQLRVTNYKKRTCFLLQDFIPTPLMPNVGLS